MILLGWAVHGCKNCCDAYQRADVTHKKTEAVLESMYIGSWLMPMMLIYWEEAYIHVH